MSNNPGTLRSVERAIRVLEVLAARGEAGVTEVASEIDVHKSTAFRLLGALEGVGIFFEPKEPYKWQILFAATLKGVLVALLTGFSLAATARWWSAMIVGAIYGLAFSLVIYLAKGGPKSGDAPYVIPSGIITGGLAGLFIVLFAVEKI